MPELRPAGLLLEHGGAGRQGMHGQVSLGVT